MNETMTERYLNEGFSGREKKRNEILQMLMIKPSFGILDEIDSGLDIEALQEQPDLFKKYFGKLVPIDSNKFSALNCAVWSGGTFIYVPKGVQVPTLVQAYFRLNAENPGQFERTLIIVDEGARLDYVGSGLIVIQELKSP